MKTRKWIILVFIILLIPIVAAIGLRFFGFQGVVNSIVLSQLRAVLGDDVTIGGAGISLGGLTLRELEYQDSDTQLKARVNRARIDINLFKIFIHGLSPIKLVDEVFIDDWTIDLSSYRSIPSSDSAKVALEDTLANPWDLVSQAIDLERINVSGGKIILKPIAVKNINGWLDFTKRDTVRTDFSAEVLSDSANLRLTGRALPKLHSAVFLMNMYRTELPAGFEPATGFRFDKGEITLELKGGIEDDSLYVSGVTGLKRILLNYNEKYEFEIDSLTASLHQDTVSFAGDARVLGQPSRFTGRVARFREPELEIMLESPQLDVAVLTKKMGYEVGVSGNLNLQADIGGAPNDLHARFNASSAKIAYSDNVFRNVNLKGNWRGSELILEKFKFESLGGAVQGAGKVVFGGKEPAVNFTSTYSGRPDLSSLVPSMGEIPIDSLELSLQGNGKLSALSLLGEFEILPTVDINRLRGDFVYSDAHLEIFQASGAGDSTGMVLDWGGRKPVFSLNGNNLHLLAKNIIPESIGELLGNSRIKASGNIEDFTLDFSASNERMDFSLKGKVFRQDIIKFLGNYNYSYNDSLEISGDMAFRVMNDTLILDNLTLGPEFFAWGTVDLIQQRIVEFEAKAETFPLSNLLHFAGLEQEENFSGDLKVELKVSGDLSSPDAELMFYLSQSTIYGKSGYWGTLAADLNRQRLNVLRVDFGNSGVTLFRGRGTIELASGELDFRSQLDNVDFDPLVNAITGRQGALTGIGRYNFKATGIPDSLTVESGLWVNNGKLFNIPFDQLAGDFALSYIQGKKGQFNINTLRLFKHDGYDLDTKGIVPLTGEELEISFVGKGNLLSILPHVERTIIRGSGSGQAELRIGGRLDSPKILSASVQYESGELRLRQAVERIYELNLDAELEGDFIHIRNLSGKIREIPFTIKTIPSAPESAPNLQPWVIEALGLKLGIITVATREEGIEINIPSFIDPKETALIKVVGRTPGETAYIAGPEANPVVRAKMIIRDAEIIFPAPGKKGTPKKSNSFQQLLGRIKWDLEVVPDRGNRYRREITGLKGNPLLENISKVDVDVNLDKKVEGLKVSGTIEDNTLTVDGEITSSRGTLSLLDLDFRVSEFTVDFEPTQKLPYVEGYATTAYRDSLGRSATITLRVVNIDPVSGEKSYRAQWGDFTFSLEDEFNNSQEQILTTLGYAPSTLSGRVSEVGAQAVNAAVFGAWLGTLERELRSILGVDYVDLNPAVAQNLLVENLFYQDSPGDTSKIDWQTKYLTKSRFTVGKYLTDDIFLTYSGRFESGETPYDTRQRLGLIHTWNLEWRLPTRGANLLMVFGYEYDSLEKVDDRQLSISYRFNF